MTSFFGFKVCIFLFFLKMTRRICAKFFSGFERKHLFITSCIEKHCTRPLKCLNCRTVSQNKQTWDKLENRLKQKFSFIFLFTRFIPFFRMRLLIFLCTLPYSNQFSFIFKCVRSSMSNTSCHVVFGRPVCVEFLFFTL